MAIIRIIILLLLPGLAIAQGNKPFGGTNANDTAYTAAGAIRAVKYANSDPTKVLTTDDRGFFILVPSSGTSLDTTDKWVNTIFKSGDSLYYSKNGAIQFIGTVGASGALTWADTSLLATQSDINLVYSAISDTASDIRDAIAQGIKYSDTGTSIVVTEAELNTALSVKQNHSDTNTYDATKAWVNDEIAAIDLQAVTDAGPTTTNAISIRNTATGLTLLGHEGLWYTQTISARGSGNTAGLAIYSDYLSTIDLYSYGTSTQFQVNSIQGFSAGGDSSNPSATPNNRTLVMMIGTGHNGTNFNSGSSGRIVIRAAGEHSPTNRGSKFEVYTTRKDRTAEMLRLEVDSFGSIHHWDSSYFHAVPFIGSKDTLLYVAPDGQLWKATYSGGGGSGGGVADGDKGDITVSSSGSVWTIDNNAVTNAKINDVAWSKITGAPSFLTTESDPVFSGSDAATIDATDISNWNDAWAFRVESLTDDGNSVVKVNNSDPANPKIEYTSENIQIGMSQVTNLTHLLDGKQPADNDLLEIAGITPANDDIIQHKAGAWTNRSMSQLKTDLALSKSDVGLSNVDNTSDATKNAATATLTNKTIDGDDNTLQDIPFTALKGIEEHMIVAISDETTDLTTGTAKVTFRMPYAAMITAVRASLSTESSSGDPTFDINEDRISILSTKLTIDVNERTSMTAATSAVISDPNIDDDAEITIDVDVSGTGAKGAKITIYYTR